MAIALFLVDVRNIAHMNSVSSFGAGLQLLIFAKDIAYEPQPRRGMWHGIFAATLMLALYATWFGIERLLPGNTMTIMQLNAIYFSSAWFLVSEYGTEGTAGVFGRIGRIAIRNTQGAGESAARKCLTKKGCFGETFAQDTVRYNLPSIS
ncbi:hypothetical protein HBI24_194790 [Parastagonospora nodorum]|nr:hypothetical protein HBH49_029220 [Parastagonospora nodorum]KAH4102422.1 hypothetical protein HBH46_127170 [Parastagonospora nodorum]KAH4133513.1 hypothetical protein HBH47_004820 [Parastagonospora nodorum]KAH4972486.1 hypothetical protein HBI78_027770 [Parastagonospora nodorum]KAH5083902.1 hypothetical protein HBH95_039220 [Parastagonospora nodorum]